ncbi:hypothetical protein ABIA39_000250 [Nocardia sp. GAS34]
MVISARISRNRIDRLLRFWVAVAALGGSVAFGAAAVSAFDIHAWVPGALCLLLAAPCALIVVLNIVVEAAGYALGWVRALGAVLALPLRMIPGGRRWIERLSLRRNVSWDMPTDRYSPPGDFGAARPALYPRARYALPEHRNGRLVVASRPRGQHNTRP